jgi:hypothetical protein
MKPHFSHFYACRSYSILTMANSTTYANLEPCSHPDSQQITKSLSEVSRSSQREKQAVPGNAPLVGHTNNDPSTKSAVVISREELIRRKHFCIFLAILSYDLKNNDPAMHQKVKKMTRYCTSRNRARDAKFRNLVDATQTRLRALVGEKQWQRSLLYTECYLLLA